MKAVFKVAKKALPSASIYFFIFIALTIAFSVIAGKEQEKMFQASEQTIVVKDEDGSVLSKALLTYLGKENEVSEDYDEKKIPDLLFSNMVDYVLYIENGFEARFLAGENNPGIEKQNTQLNTAFLDEKIEMFFGYVRAALATGATIEEACEKVIKIAEMETVTEFVGEKKSNMNNPAYFFNSYIAYGLPAVLIMIVGPMIQAFYRKDVKMRLDCGKESTRMQNLRIIAGISMIAAALWGIIMGIEAVFYTKYVTVESYFGNMINSFLFLLISLAISVVMGILVKGKDALNGASNLISMGMAFLCGVFVPYDFLPDYVKKIAVFLPASWYVKNVEMLAEGGKMTAEFFKNCGVLVAFVAALFCLVLVIAKRKKVA